MGIPTSCLAFDITLGCSGFLVGLGVMGNLMASGSFRKGLLMVGNTQSEYASPEDRSMTLLLGDAGTVTAIEYDPNSKDEINITYMSDGSGREFVILPDGGSRNPVNEKSFIMEDCGNGIRRTRLHEKMIGDEVFSYGTHFIPKVYQEMREKFNISEERAKELEEMCTQPQLTEDEKEYLEAIKEEITDGIIPERSRRLLERLRLSMDIDEDRANEIERIALK
jgi:3-oxoacyl-[acyl-carrier-protein] synthase-3